MQSVQVLKYQTLSRAQNQPSHLALISWTWSYLIHIWAATCVSSKASLIVQAFGYLVYIDLLVQTEYGSDRQTWQLLFQWWQTASQAFFGGHDSRIQHVPITHKAVFTMHISWVKISTFSNLHHCFSLKIKHGLTIWRSASIQLLVATQMCLFHSV